MLVEDLAWREEGRKGERGGSGFGVCCLWGAHRWDLQVEKPLVVGNEGWDSEVNLKVPWQIYVFSFLDSYDNTGKRRLFLHALFIGGFYAILWKIIIVLWIGNTCTWFRIPSWERVYTVSTDFLFLLCSFDTHSILLLPVSIASFQKHVMQTKFFIKIPLIFMCCKLLSPFPAT